MRNEPIRLLAYGTLRVGRSNYAAIARYVVAAEPATTEGVLVDLGSFPALVPGRGITEGDLLTVEPEALLITDRIEGVAHSFYIRRQVEVRLTSGATVTAWAYIYGNPAVVKDRPLLIVRVEGNINVYAWPPAPSRRV